MGRGRSRIAVVTLPDPGPAAAALAAESKRPRGAHRPTNTAAVDAAVGSAASPVTPPEREGRARSAKKRRRAVKAACLWCYKEARGSAGVGALC